MDGLSGIKIYNAVNVDTRFLPRNYPENLQFIIKGVNHKLSNSDWETNIETIVISKNENTDVTYPFLKTTIDEILQDKINPVASWLGPVIGNSINQFKSLSTIDLFKGSSKYDFNQTVSFLTDVLKGIGIPKPNSSQISFIKSWKQKEASLATFNPFNSILKKPGSKPFNTNNGFPVQNYPDRATGLNATLNTLLDKRYSEIIKAIKNIKTDQDINKAMQAVNDSPWGSNFTPPDYRYWKTLNNFIAIPPIISK
jgi:hypothetical protein